MERKILDAEWTILRALWGRKPQAMHEIIENIQNEQPDIGWHYKTYHTYLRLMLEKGLIGCEDKNNREKLYRALISKEKALKQESEALISRISTGSMGLLVSMMAENGQLSEEDRDDLKKLAARLEEGGEHK